MEQDKVIKIDCSDTIEVNTRYSTRMEKENVSSLKTGSIIAFCIGLSGVVGYIILTIIHDTNAANTLLLLLSSLLVGFGLVFWLASNKAVKDSEKIEGINYFVFAKDAVLISSYIDGEYVSEGKMYYKNFTKLKETAHYLFFCSPRGNYGVDKGFLSADEVEKIRVWFNSCRPQKQQKTKE